MPRPRKLTVGLPRQHNGRERFWWRGEWHDLGIAGSPEARAEYARLAALFAADPTATPRRQTDYLVPELCADFLDVPEHAHLRHASRYGRAVELLNLQHLATCVDDFEPRDFLAWLLSLANLKRERNGVIEPKYTSTYIRKLRQAIIAIWRWGVATGRVRVESLNGLQTVDVPANRTRPETIRPSADPDHVRAAMLKMRGPIRTLVALQLHTGARPSELLTLTPRDIHRTGRLQLPGAGWYDVDASGVWVIVPRTHKTAHHGNARTLFIGPALQSDLLRYLDRPDDQPLFQPRETVAELRADQRARRKGPGDRKPKAAEPKRRPGTTYTPHTYCKAVRRACIAAGVAIWTPYQLRHLAAEQVDLEHGESAVQEFLGHTNPAVTARYRKRRAAVKRVSEIAAKRGKIDN